MCENSHTPDFDWDALRSFLAVVRTGRLTTAALQLKIDHSTLSRRIAALETSLRAQLFDRLPSGYVLTAAGDRLVVEAEKMENVAIRIASELAEGASQISGPLRVAMPEGFGTYFLSRQMRTFAEHYPDVSVELIANPNGVSVTKRQADIAITMSRPETGPLRAQKLASYEYGLYGSKDLLLGRIFESLEDVAAYRLIGYIPDLLPTPAHNYLKDLFKDRRADLQISNILTQLNATLNGYGLCVLPCFIADTHTNLERVLPEQVCITRSYWMVTHAEVRVPERVKAMKNFLIDVVAQHRSQFLPSDAGGR